MSIFDIPINLDDVTAAPGYQPLPTGTYVTTLTGASLKENDSGWKAVRLEFEGLTDEDGKEYNRKLNVQYTLDHATSEQAIQIGAEQVYKAAYAFGLVGQGADGAATLLIEEPTPEAIVKAFDEAQGTQATVYVKTGPRTRKGQAVLKDNGEPFIDSEIKSVRSI
jgi:hypothetical protein